MTGAAKLRHSGSVKFKSTILKSTFLFLLGCCSAAVFAAPVQKTESLIAVIAPAPGEQSWLKIPWETDLTAARRKAVAENKPIFLWEMDGNPLGCT